MASPILNLKFKCQIGETEPTCKPLTPTTPLDLGGAGAGAGAGEEVEAGTGSGAQHLPLPLLLFDKAASVPCGLQRFGLGIERVSSR